MPIHDKSAFDNLVRFFFILCGHLLTTSAGGAQELKTLLIDTKVKESLQCVRVDTMGRLFVGGAQTLFVYEPNDQGGYLPGKLLHRFHASSEVSDIEVRGNDLYILTPNALYLLADGVSKRDDPRLKKLLWGVPLTDAQQGLQALAWGPEGDLYFTLGDALGDYGDPLRSDHWGHWTFFIQPEGTRTPYTGVGGVLRCKPDGSELRIVARGLRNPCGLVFDRYWNLFSNDRLTPTAAELLHIAPHAFFSCRADLLPAMSGMQEAKLFRQGYYDDGLLPEKYRNQLLVAAGEKILRCAVEPKGASFKAISHSLFRAQKNAQIVGITVGRGGRIFATLRHESGKSDLVMMTTADDPATHPFEPYEATEASPDKLWQELNDPSWQRRYRAHIELTRRGGTLLNQANKKLLTAKADDPNLHHLIWLSAISRQRSLHLFALLDDADPKIRVQVLRALTEFPEQLRDEPIFTKFLLDDDLQVQHTAVLAHFAPKVIWSRPIQQAVERGAACSKDAYLRQSATLLLAEKATRKEIETLCGRVDAEMRLAGVLAAGWRLTLPSATKPLPPHLPLAKPPMSACFFAEGESKLDLCKLGRVGQFTVAEHWKANKHSEEQEVLFALLRKMLGDADPSIRLQAAHFLSLLNDARCAAEVERVLK